MPNVIKCFATFEARGMRAVLYFDVELEEGDTPATFSDQEWQDIMREEAEQSVYDLFTVNSVPDVLEFDRV
jgi:hypothetical protein